MILNDIPRVYTGIAEWLACLVLALQFRPRLGKKAYPLAALAGLGVQCGFLLVTDNAPTLLWVVCMFLAIAMMMLFIWLLADIDWLTAAYTCMRAFIVAEFVAALQWQLHLFLWPQDNHIFWQRYGLLALIFGGVFLTVYLLERKLRSDAARLLVTWRELLVVSVLGLAIFAISNMSFYYDESPFAGQSVREILNIRTFADLAGVAVLYAFHITHCEAAAQKELGAMQTMLENQYAQYRMSRDSIELINRKYHDLKHQIQALRAEPDAKTRNRWLDEMEADIRSYEAQNKTGHTVLDTLLTGKSLYCQKHGIGMTVVADGKHLAFMDTMDICTIFGNALDNAIEHELTIPDKTRRMIHLSLSAQKQFLLLQVENYCPEPPQLRGGLPKTTKADPQNHGFGLKSIRHTVQKYGGTTTVQTEADWFLLKILIPLPPQ